MWILSRTASIPDETVKKYLSILSSLGYDLNKIVWTDQGPYDATVYDAK